MSNIILKSHIKIADRHVDRISMAFRHLLPFFPLTQDKLKIFSDEHFGYLEIITNRFAKLQDLIGSKIFFTILEMLENDPYKLCSIDRFNILEQAEFLTDVQMWLLIKDVRNAVTHEYPEDPVAVFNDLINTIQQTEILLNYWAFLKNQIEQRILKEA